MILKIEKKLKNEKKKMEGKDRRWLVKPDSDLCRGKI